jgi:NAD(P)-dependent dehydrogenase (short-subunit alcohol dehydrogenase family)
MKEYQTEFLGTKVLVTGGSRGIGAAAAQRLIDGGAIVAVSARSRHEQTPKGAVFIKGDLSTREGANAVAEQALKILGGLDILINCAGALWRS